MFKAILLVCSQAFLIQSISGQCYGPYPALTAAQLAAAPCGAGWGYAAPAQALAASNSPGLAISSAFPISPVGVSVASENVIEGALSAGGALPFLGTVSLEGALPTAGAGDVAYNCGSGAVAITAEDVAVAPLGFAAAGPLGLAAASYTGAYGYGAVGGCGCGAYL